MPSMLTSREAILFLKIRSLFCWGRLYQFGVPSVRASQLQDFQLTYHAHTTFIEKLIMIYYATSTIELYKLHVPTYLLALHDFRPLIPTSFCSVICLSCQYTKKSFNGAKKSYNLKLSNFTAFCFQCVRACALFF